MYHDMLFIIKHILLEIYVCPINSTCETIQYSFNKTKEQVRKPITCQKKKITYRLIKSKYTICKEIGK
jgi:uncharacterized protein YbaR (Trm112 family)